MINETMLLKKKKKRKVKRIKRNHITADEGNLQ